MARMTLIIFKPVSLPEHTSRSIFNLWKVIFIKYNYLINVSVVFVKYLKITVSSVNHNTIAFKIITQVV